MCPKKIQKRINKANSWTQYLTSGWGKSFWSLISWIETDRFFSPEVVELGAGARDEQELSWCQLGDGDLSENSPWRRQHVADVSLANLKSPFSKDEE